MLSKLKSLAGKVLEARNYSKNWVMPGLRRALGMHSTLKVWVNTPSGASVWLDKDPIDDLILKDLYEIPSVFFPEKMKFTAGDMILDLGSHHGIYIIEMLVRNPELYAVCVEPDPWGCHLMHKMAEKNKVADRIEIHNVAVGSEEGEAYLVESEDGSWGNYVSESEVAKGKRIKQAPLSSITRNRYFKLLKCNTEGGEYVIMPQALDLKLNPEFIILMTHGNKNIQAELLSKIERAGYSKKLVNDLPDNPSWHFTRINK